MHLWFQDKEKQTKEINMEYSFRPVQNMLMEYTYFKNTLSFLKYVKCLSFVCKTNKTNYMCHL